MTREEMREGVLAIVNKWPNTPSGAIADAVIDFIRGETLEEAARVVWADRVKDPYKDGDYGWNAAMEAAAAAIRALKDKP